MNTSAQRPKLLVIDDDEAVTDVLQLKLAAAFDVVALNDPLQALEVAKRERPSAVVCDIDMPRMDGAAVRRAFANDSSTRELPFLFLTALRPTETSGGASLDGAPSDRADGPRVSKLAPVAEIISRIRAMLAP